MLMIFARTPERLPSNAGSRRKNVRAHRKGPVRFESIAVCQAARVMSRTGTPPASTPAALTSNVAVPSAREASSK